MSQCKLSDSEFIQYLWINNLHSNPIVARLIDMAADAAAYRLVFGDDLDVAKERLDANEMQLSENEATMDEMQKEITRLENRTVIQLLADTQSHIEKLDSQVRHLNRDLDSARAEKNRAFARAEAAKEKLDMWGALAT